MYMKVYSLYDRAADQYQAPFYQHSLGLVNRALQDEIDNSESTLSSHYRDFSLFELGVYDTVTGTFTLHDAPKLVYDLESLVGSK